MNGGVFFTSSVASATTHFGCISLFLVRKGCAILCCGSHWCGCFTPLKAEQHAHGEDGSFGRNTEIVAATVDSDRCSRIARTVRAETRRGHHHLGSSSSWSHMWPQRVLPSVIVNDIFLRGTLKLFGPSAVKNNIKSVVNFRRIVKHIWTVGSDTQFNNQQVIIVAET